jgi:hypothetical protein
MQTKQRKPPTPKLYFEMRALCPEIAAASAINDAQARARKAVSKRGQEWFIKQAEIWVRWFHANDRRWHTRLERESDEDRDTIFAFLNHWADAFVQDPEQYRRRHSIESLDERRISNGDVP